MRLASAGASALVLALATAGCGSPRDAPPSGRVLVDGTGAEVPVPRRARRIVSLAPDLTQTLFALGAGASVVGVSEACDRPAGRLQSVERVGAMVEPSVERIVALEPDLVLASADGNPLATLERLRGLGVTVLGVKPAAGGLEGVAERVLTVAAASGREDAGRSAVARLRLRLERVRQQAAGRSPLPACWLVWEDPPIAAGAETFVAGLMQAVGLENACGRADESWPSLSREQLLVAAPQALVVTAGGHGRGVAEGLGSWAAPLPAVRSGRVLRLDPDRFLRPTLDLGDAAEELLAASAAWWGS